MSHATLLRHYFLHAKTWLVSLLPSSFFHMIAKTLSLPSLTQVMLFSDNKMFALGSVKNLPLRCFMYTHFNNLKVQSVYNLWLGKSTECTKVACLINIVLKHYSFSQLVWLVPTHTTLTLPCVLFSVQLWSPPLGITDWRGSLPWHWRFGSCLWSCCQQINPSHSIYLPRAFCQAHGG